MIVKAVEFEHLSEEEYKILLEKIPEKKKIQAEKFRFKEDSWRTILGYNLLFKILKENFGTEKADIIFNEYGKPFLKGEDVFFNISHCENVVVCAADTAPLGIDIQKKCYDKKIIGIAKDVFTKKEYGEFCGLGERQKYDYFLRIHTKYAIFFIFLGKKGKVSLVSLKKGYTFSHKWRPSVYLC